MSVSSGLYSFSKAFVLITEGGISDTKFQHILEVFHETNTSKLAQGKGGGGGISDENWVSQYSSPPDQQPH